MNKLEKEIVGGTIIDTGFLDTGYDRDWGYIIEKDGIQYFLGFTDLQEQYIHKLGKKDKIERNGVLH